MNILNNRFFIFKGPIAVGIVANCFSFIYYYSGILNDPSCIDGIDHSVTAVGFGTDAVTGLDYYFIKNRFITLNNKNQN
jgi:hypothetical protein